MKKKLAIVSLIVLSVFSLFIAGCSKKTEKYTVTFDSDGGTEIASVQVEKGKKITKPEDPSKEHYVFDGWYLDDTEWVFESDTVTKNTALTAKWTPEVYTQKLRRNGTCDRKRKLRFAAAIFRHARKTERRAIYLRVLEMGRRSG